MRQGTRDEVEASICGPDDDNDGPAPPVRRVFVLAQRPEPVYSFGDLDDEDNSILQNALRGTNNDPDGAAFAPSQRWHSPHQAHGPPLTTATANHREYRANSIGTASQASPTHAETILHTLCETALTAEDFLDQVAGALSVRRAGSQDGHGRTPLHCLSLNHHLANATLTKFHRALLEAGTDGIDGVGVPWDSGFHRHPGGGTGGATVKSRSHVGYYGADLATAYSENGSIPSTHSLGHDFVEFVVSELWRAYRPAMITPDRFGYIPFQEALVEWIKDAHLLHDPAGALSPNNAGARNSFWAKGGEAFRNRWSQQQPTPASPSAADLASPEPSRFSLRGRSPPPPPPPQSNNSSAAAGPPLHSRSTLVGGKPNGGASQPFPVVRLTPQAIYALTLLSAMIEAVDQRTAKPQQQRRRQQPPPPRELWNQIERRPGVTTATGADPSSPHGGRALHEAVHQLRTMTVEDIGSEIVQSVASIPDLLKTIFLIENDQQREYVLSTTIVRRVLVSRYSVGPWLTKMLSSANKRASDRGIEYLRIVSDSELFDSADPRQSSWRRSKSSFNRAGSNLSAGGDYNDGKDRKKNPQQDDLYNEVSNLQDFVPSLLALGERDVEDAATTLVVRKVLDQLITRPFAATVILCDALLLILLITGLRVSTNRLLLGAPKSTVVNYLYIADTGLFYFIMRELGKAVSLLMVTKRARVYFWSFWNLCDLVSTVLALASVVCVRLFCNSPATVVEAPLRNLISLATGFLWLRVLSFLKGINEQLATFVLCILNIVRDITWFCVILLTLVVAFAQMFFTVLVPNYCTDPTAPEFNGECTPSEYYFRVYGVLLGNYGDFERQDFATVFSVILIVCFTFMVALVLLNVLIAVASDSYERCLIRSANLFGRARVMLIAELVSFQNLLRRNVDQARAPRRVYNAFWSSGINGWSRGSVMYFSLASLVVAAWLMWDITAIFYGAGYGNVLLGLGSILINLLIFVGIMIFLSTGAMDISRRTKNSKVTSSEDEPHPHRLCGERYGNFLQNMVMRLLGSSSTSSSAADRQAAVDNWHGRLVFLQREIVRVATESSDETSRKIHGLEQVLQQTDNRLRSELALLESGIAEIKADLRAALGRR